MPLDNSQFENYLRQFHPVAPEELAFRQPVRTAVKPRFRLVWACVAAAVLIGGLFVARPRTVHQIEKQITSSDTQHYALPLTASRANAELSDALSAKEALDRMAFRPQFQLRRGEQSALGVLGKEKIKL